MPRRGPGKGRPLLTAEEIKKHELLIESCTKQRKNTKSRSRQKELTARIRNMRRTLDLYEESKNAQEGRDEFRIR